MHAHTVDRLFAGFLFCFGAYITWNALDYGYLRDNRPGPGFFPFWVGLGLTGLSIANFVRSVRGREQLGVRFNRRELRQGLGIVAAIATYIVFVRVLGTLLGIGLVVVATAFIIRPGRDARFLATVAAIAVVLPIACYYLFDVYLQVPLIVGVFGF